MNHRPMDESGPGPVATKGYAETRPSVFGAMLKWTKSRLAEPAVMPPKFADSIRNGWHDGVWYEQSGRKSRLAYKIGIGLCVLLFLWMLIQVVCGYRNDYSLSKSLIFDNPKGLQLPYIYLCPGLDPTSSYTADHFWKHRHTEGLLKPHPKSINAYIPKDNIVSSDANRSVSLPESIEEYFMKTGYESDALFNCFLGTDAINCDAEAILDKDYGKCFLIKNHTQTTSDGGIRLVLKLNSPQNSIILKLADRHEINGGKQIVVQPNTYTQVLLEATRTKLDYDEKCAKDNEISFKSTDEHCVPDQLHFCVQPNMEKEKDELQECISHCHLPCERWKYHTDVSVLPLDAEQLMDEYNPEKEIMPSSVVFSNETVSLNTTTEPPGPRESVCDYDRDVGYECDPPGISILGWYWDRKDNRCAEMVFTGCGGNRNFFATEHECLSSCSVGLRACLARPERGSCDERMTRWYWFNDVLDCYEFTFSGCEANNNNFLTEQQCVDHCADIRGIACFHSHFEGVQCDLENVQIRYYFDDSSGACEQFFYHGCGNTGNNFLTKEECEAYCTDENLNENCTTPVNKDDCAGTRYTFDVETGSCKEFYYKGCEGTKNNFDSLESCQQTCPADLLSRTLRHKRETSANEAAGHFVLLDISFASLEFTFITQKSISMSFGTFVSHVGGLIAFFFGVSVMTLFKLIIVIVNYNKRKIGDQQPIRKYGSYLNDYETSETRTSSSIATVEV